MQGVAASTALSSVNYKNSLLASPRSLPGLVVAALNFFKFEFNCFAFLKSDVHCFFPNFIFLY